MTPSVDLGSSGRQRGRPGAVTGSEVMWHAGGGGHRLLDAVLLEERGADERETIMRVFEQTKGDKALTGRMLGISRATLYRKLKRYNIGSASAMATTPS